MQTDAVRCGTMRCKDFPRVASPQQGGVKELHLYNIAACSALDPPLVVRLNRDAIFKVGTRTTHTDPLVASGLRLRMHCAIEHKHVPYTGNTCFTFGRRLWRFHSPYRSLRLCSVICLFCFEWKKATKLTTFKGDHESTRKASAWLSKVWLLGHPFVPPHFVVGLTSTTK